MSESMSTEDAKMAAKDRDGWECRFCGMSNEEHLDEFGRGLHAHHIVKDGDNGEDHPRNLITVCRDCHNTLENTQADALSRIRTKHVKEAVADKEDKIEDLERALADYEAMTKDLEDREERLESVLDELERFKVNVYTTHETKTVTSELRYVGTDPDAAYEKFKECENHATVETASIWLGLDDLEAELPRKIAEELQR